MKKYKLLKDLPTFKAGERFYLDNSGNLCAEDRQNTGFCKLIAYSKFTLDRFPTILTNWFEEIKDEWEPWRARFLSEYYYVSDDGIVKTDIECGDGLDDWRHKVGNYFRTKEEAERAKAKLEAHATVKRDAKGFKPDWNSRKLNYEVGYNSMSGEYAISPRVWHNSLCEIIFDTFDDAEHSLDEHPDEWRLLFDLDKEEK